VIWCNSAMNQRTMISAGSWAATIVVLLFGFWLGKQFGSAVMWTTLTLILGLLVFLNVWIGSKAARARLELQEVVRQLVSGRSVEEITRLYPDFLVKVRRWSDGNIEALFEALDEDKARDLRKALFGDGSSSRYPE